MTEQVKRRLRPGGWLLVAVTGFALAADGAGAGIAVDGCVALGQAVSRSVGEALESRLYGSPRLRSPKPTLGAARQSCGMTAAVTSSAFTKALRAYGIEVGWNDGLPGSPGDACLSHYLDQCYPDLQRGALAPVADGGAFVARAWTAVRAGVGRSMPFGTHSDLAWFRPAELTESLAVAVDATLALPEAPPCASTRLDPCGGEN